MSSWILIVLVCAGLGAAWGRFGKCATGACSLTANWKRGAFVGALIGAAIYLTSGGSYQPPKNIKHVTEADFAAEVTSATMPVVVDFYAPWCGPCKALSPRLDALAGEYSGKVKFVAVNVDEAPSLASKLNVQGIPTVIFLGPDGRIVDVVIGLASKDELNSKLASLIIGKAKPMAKLTD